jgi:hypothetical protein
MNISINRKLRTLWSDLITIDIEEIQKISSRTKLDKSNNSHQEDLDRDSTGKI